MTTLATLKAEIADDLDRTDLTDQIASAITRAIKKYRHKRFWWTQTRDVTFATVANQTTYGVADSADIPNIIRVDTVFVLISDNQLECSRISFRDWEEAVDNTSTTGQPWSYNYIAEQFRLYPIPDAAYTMRVHCDLQVAAPASDSETDNRWMTDAYDLIRAEATRWLATYSLRDYELAGIMEREARARLHDLTAESDLKTDDAGGVIAPTDF